MGPQEGIQHGSQQPGHAAVHHHRPLGVSQVQVANRQELHRKVSHAHSRPAQEAGRQSDGSNASVGPWMIKSRGEEKALDQIKNLQTASQISLISDLKSVACIYL